MTDFDYGKFYLVRGRPDILWFLLKDTEFQYFSAPSAQTIWLHATTWGEPATYLVSLMNLKELQLLTEVYPSEDVRVFFILSDLEGNLNKEAEKVYKSLAGDQFVQVDVDKYGWQNDPGVINALRASKLPEREKVKLLTDFNNPLALLQQLKSEDPMDYELPHTTETKIEELLDCLGTKESFDIWGNLSTGELYRLLLSSDPTKSGFYQVLTGKGGAKGGMCPALWHYLSMFMELCESNKIAIAPNYAVQLFVRWVYLASTKLATDKYRGFVINQRGPRKYYNLEVSQEAWKAFERTTSFSFLIS